MQAAAVTEHHGYGDILCSRQLREIFVQSSVEIELVLVDELKDDRGGKHLGDGCDTIPAMNAGGCFVCGGDDTVAYSPIVYHMPAL